MFKDRKIIDFLFTASPVADLMFSCFTFMVGASFAGSESSPVYKIYMAGVGSLVIGYTFLLMLRRQLVMNVTFWTLMIWVPLLFAADYYLETGTTVMNVGFLDSFILMMICFSYTAICCGIYIAQQPEGIRQFAKYWDVIMLFFTACFFMYIPASLAGLVWIGGASYQIMSYIAGFTFLLNLCMILWGDNYDRFRLFKSDRWPYIAYFLLVIQLVCCLITSGRGGFVVIAVGTAYMIYRSKKVGRTLMVGIFVSLIGLTAISFTDSPLMSRLQQTTQRTFSVFQSGSADEAMGKSGREGGYQWAWGIVEDTHYMGEGLCKGIVDGYPHNIILEFLMQGGVIYTLIWIVVLLMTIFKIHNLNKSESSYILYPLFFFPMIQLVFSGSYLTTPLFWFIICYSFSRIEYISKF